MQLRPVITKIEEFSAGRPFGGLPKLRKMLKGLAHVHRRIFYLPPSENYAFHYGGRRELQFNVGLEDTGKTLRYGVAFSFEGSRNLQSLDVLRKSFDRFNAFVKMSPAYLSRFSMWNYQPGIGRSERRPVEPISDELFRWKVFVFVGHTQIAKSRSIDYDGIIDDLDRLMPLYEFVEGEGKAPPVIRKNSRFIFQPGCSIRAFSAEKIVSERTIEIDLRQKRIQDALHRYLVSCFGRDNVGVEQRTFNRSVDLAVQKGGKLWYYEVKTAQSAMQCIREALGQLLEYSYWPLMQEADRLIIVGQESSTAASRKYISLLRKRFKIPVEYQQFNLSMGELIST
jgi:hypothetical protein